MATTAELDQGPVKFSPALKEFIQKWRERPGNLIMILHKVQEEFDYIPRDAALQLSRMLDVPLAKIYGVLTFYHLFRTEQPGKHKIAVCMGTACYLRGGEDLLGELENILGSGPGGITEDGLFSVEAVRCVGCCGLAPVLTVDGETFGKVTSEQLPEIIARFQDQ